MKKKVLFSIVAVSIAAILIDFNHDVQGNLSAGPARETGSPFDGGDCTDCHSGSGGTASITSTIPASGYIAGTTYAVTATTTYAGLVKFGFEISPQTAAGTLVGTMTAGTVTQLISAGKYITHTSAGTTGTTGSHTWTFTWTAPAAGTGAFTFYGSFNNTNNNGSSSGDHVVDATLAVTENNSTPAIPNQTATICSGNSFSITPVNGVPTSATYVPSGTTYTWSAPAVTGGITGGSAQATGQTAISQTLTNPTTSIQTATYTVTPKSSLSTGANFTVTVTVDPLPVATFSYAGSPYCSNAANPSPAYSGGGVAGTFSSTGGLVFLSTSTGAINLAASTAGTYTVTNTIPAAGLCSAVSATSTITIKSAPSVSVNSPTVCAGQTANLTANGGTTYSWSPGVTSTGANTGTAAPSITATYTVTGTTAGCSSTAPATITVTPLPPVTVNSPGICLAQTANLTASGATSYTWSSGVTVTGTNTADATPATTTTYTVTGTSGSCSKTAVATVTVNPFPTITVNSPAICPGQTATLTANGGSTYTWSAGATSTGVNTAHASPATTTSYTVTGTASGCSATATAVSTVTVNPPPVITVTSPTICDGQVAHLTAGGGTSYTWSPGVIFSGGTTATATPNTTTTYTVTGTSGGCSNTAVSTVTVNPIPVITVNSAAICAGQTAVLTANGGTTYIWSSGAVSSGGNTANASPLTTSTYTVTGIATGCSSTATSTVTVTPLPNLTTSMTNSTTITSNQIGASYQWIDCNNGNTAIVGDTNQTFTPAITGNYSVFVSLNGCADTSACALVITVGINQLNEDNMLTVSPNPFSSETTISFGKEQTNTIVKIINIVGREIKTIRINNSNTVVLEKGEMQSGIYFLQIIDENKNSVNRKIIVEQFYKIKSPEEYN